MGLAVDGCGRQFAQGGKSCSELRGGGPGIMRCKIVSPVLVVCATIVCVSALSHAQSLSTPQLK